MPTFRGLAIGCAVAALGAFVGFKTGGIGAAPGYSFVGPRVFPYAIAALLAGVGVGLCFSAWFGGAEADGRDETEVSTESGSAIRWVIAGLAANFIGLVALGFVFAATIQYVLTARGFGSRRPFLDLASGLGLATSAYLLFSKALGVRIPPGPILEFIFQWVV